MAGYGKERGLQLRFHRVGSKQIDDVVVFEDKKNYEHTFDAQVSEDDQLLLLHVFKGGVTSCGQQKLPQKTSWLRFDPNLNSISLSQTFLRLNGGTSNSREARCWLMSKVMLETSARFCCFLTGMFPLPNSLSQVPSAAFAQARLVPGSV